jgi:hypothetical protein
VAAILIQLFRGQYDISLGEYLRWYLLPGTIDMIILAVLAVFAAGAALGVIAMLPGAWQRWQRRRPAASRPASEGAAAVPAPSTLPSGFGPDQQPPRVGL